MSRNTLVFIGIGLSLGLAALHVAPTRAQEPPPPGLERLMSRAQTAGRLRVIVGRRGSVAARGQAEHVRAMQQLVSVVRAGTMAHVRTLDTLPFFSADVDATALAELAASPLVGSIQEDVARPMALSESGPLVEAPQAWDAGFSGSGWTVAVLDSGVDSAHPFFSGKLAGEACYSTTDDSGRTSSSSVCPGGLTSAQGTGTAAPCQPYVINCDHGTHVAGIAVGAGPSFSGVARDARLLAVQVFSKFGPADCGSSDCLLAWDSDVIAALDYVYSVRDSLHIASVNLSLGGALYSSSCDDASPAMAAAIAQLRQAGIATIVASGNGGSATSLAFPACLSAAVSVGSTTKADQVSSFSNGGQNLLLLAPGESINSSLPGGGFGYKSGTSMAAPHVAGAWAVIRQRKPSATVDEVLQSLRSTGRPIVDPRTGATIPRIRVKAALDGLVVSSPVMAIDSPAAGQTPQPIVVSGWAADRGAADGVGVDAVHVWAYPSDGRAPSFAGAATLGDRRDDLVPLLGAQFRDAGFHASVQGLAPGSYTLVVFAHSTVTDTFNQTRRVDVTIPAADPLMALDRPSNSSTVGAGFTIEGWAVDRAAASGTGVDAVHVWAFPAAGGDPRFLGVASYGGNRPDVGDLLGRRFDRCGYSLNVTSLPSGTYDLVVYAHSSASGTFNQARTVRVTR